MISGQTEKKIRVLKISKKRGHAHGVWFFMPECEYSLRLLKMVRRTNFSREFIDFLVGMGVHFEINTQAQDKKDDAYIDKKLEQKGYANVIKFKEVQLFGKGVYYRPETEISKRVCDAFGRKTLSREQVEVLEYIQNVTAKNLVKDEIGTLLKETKKERADENKQKREEYSANRARYRANNTAGDWARQSYQKHSIPGRDKDNAQ